MPSRGTGSSRQDALRSRGPALEEGCGAERVKLLLPRRAAKPGPAQGHRAGRRGRGRRAAGCSGRGPPQRKEGPQTAPLVRGRGEQTMEAEGALPPEGGPRGQERGRYAHDPQNSAYRPDRTVK